MSLHRIRRSLFVTFALAAGFAGSHAVHAQAEPLIGQIAWFPYNFCPRGWAEAAGQLLPISTNAALFSLLGTNYGGNGQTTFALPDLRGRAAISAGQGAGLQNFFLGQVGGTETQSLTFAQMPAHSHTASTSISGLEITSSLHASSESNTTSVPAGAALGVAKRQVAVYASASPDVEMAAGSVTSTVSGGTAETTVNATNSGTSPVPVRDPYLTLQACIALVGIYPSRN